MGYSILELVLRRLREEGFTASVAYPGQMFPEITDTVAAVHIDEVNRGELSVTIEVTLICPASVGGTKCEMEALRVTEILRWTGAVCVQKGCSYDGVAQVYMVSILATYIGVTEAYSCVIWPGFHCYVGGVYHRYAEDFQTEQTKDIQLIHSMGEAAAADLHPGEEVWQLRLEELIPTGSEEAEETQGVFELRILTELATEVYSGCRWTSIQCQRTRKGLRRIFKGYALSREVTV